MVSSAWNDCDSLFRDGSYVVGGGGEGREYESNRGLRLNPSPMRISLGAIQPVKTRSQKPFQERRPLFEVVADRALDGVDARRPPASAKTSAGLFSTASRRTSSVCHIEEWETSHQKRL